MNATMLKVEEWGRVAWDASKTGRAANPMGRMVFRNEVFERKFK